MDLFVRQKTRSQIGIIMLKTRKQIANAYELKTNRNLTIRKKNWLR